MIIESLTVSDFRVFQGEQTFDLSPRVKYGKKRPIILFGGLNGAGKTSTLTAVRLALYGKQSLGLMVGQKTYEEYLLKNIHRPKNNPVVPTHAYIELKFAYTSMGEVRHYSVKRAWTNSKSKIHETLEIFEGDKRIESLDYNQCQSFLNELVPIGVSELFFFDGEKIKELAEESGGAALGDSIKKLLGLDLIERLNADLSVLIRNQQKAKASVAVQAEIVALETELKSTEVDIELERKQIEYLTSRLLELMSNSQRLEVEINSRGGAWATTREAEIERQSQLSVHRLELQEQLREVISGEYPLSLAKIHATQTLLALGEELEARKTEQTSFLIKGHLESLKLKLNKLLDKKDVSKVASMINIEFNDYLESKDYKHRLHDISDTALGRIQTAIQDAVHNQAIKARNLADELISVEEKIDAAGLNIARAPEQSTIQPLLDQLGSYQQERGRIEQTITSHRESAKTLIKKTIEIIRKLEKLHSEYSSIDEQSRVLNYAVASRGLLDDFVTEMTVRKIKDLESEFVNCFHTLARKDDVTSSIRVNPNDFRVELIDHNGHIIDKDELSAGEKQIYAISILEALGRTSGRKLPIIIDTPLGRLDSIHRKKLVENYFPYASHQVIILSTDTEVDSNFYKDLNRHISHAYHLEYDNSSKSTYASEGYFWKQLETA